MERKVGEVFEVNGVKLKCVKHNHNCKDCYFHGKIIQCFRQKCNCLYRKDLSYDKRRNKKDTSCHKRL